MPDRTQQNSVNFSRVALGLLRSIPTNEGRFRSALRLAVDCLPITANVHLEDECIVRPQVHVLAHLSHARVETVVDQPRRVDGWEQVVEKTEEHSLIHGVESVTAKARAINERTLGVRDPLAQSER